MPTNPTSPRSRAREGKPTSKKWGRLPPHAADSLTPFPSQPPGVDTLTQRSGRFSGVLDGRMAPDIVFDARCGPNRLLWDHRGISDATRRVDRRGEASGSSRRAKFHRIRRHRRAMVDGQTEGERSACSCACVHGRRGRRVDLPGVGGRQRPFDLRRQTRPRGRDGPRLPSVGAAWLRSFGPPGSGGEFLPPTVAERFGEWLGTLETDGSR